MKILGLWLMCLSMTHSAVLWNYDSGLHTTVIEQNGKYLFRYNYTPEKLFQFPNIAYVFDYRVEYEKETFEYGSSYNYPIWGTVEFDGMKINTYIPIPEHGFSYLIFISTIGLIIRRR